MRILRTITYFGALSADNRLVEGMIAEKTGLTQNMQGIKESKEELARMVKRDFRRVRKTVRQYPERSILIAFGTGLFLGALAVLGSKK